jgi:hypothetical protein
VSSRTGRWRGGELGDALTSGGDGWRWPSFGGDSGRRLARFWSDRAPATTSKGSECSTRRQCPRGGAVLLREDSWPANRVALGDGARRNEQLSSGSAPGFKRLLRCARGRAEEIGVRLWELGLAFYWVEMGEEESSMVVLGGGQP